MKKVLATFALGALLVAGFSVTQDNPTDTAIEREPTVYSMNNTLF